MLKKILLPLVVASVGGIGVQVGLHYSDSTPVYSKAFIEYRKLDERIEDAYSRNVFSNPDSSEVYRDLISRSDSLAATNRFVEDKRKERREETKRNLLSAVVMGSAILFLGGSARFLYFVGGELTGSED